MPALTAALFAVIPALDLEPSQGAGSLVEIKDGVQLFVSEQGRGEPVLMLHGGFMDSTMWDGEAAWLQHRYRVIRYDMRGYGRSPASTAPYQPTADIAALLDRLQISKARIVGISMGGGLAVDFALAYPARVGSLFLAEPGLSGWRWSAQVNGTMQAVMAADKERGREAAIEVFLKQPVFASAAGKPEAMAAIRAQLERNFSLQPRGAQQPTNAAVDRLREIAVPTWVLTAEHGGPDAVLIAKRIQTEVRGARAVAVKGTGHMINLEVPMEFRRLLEDFLRQHPLR